MESPDIRVLAAVVEREGRFLVGRRPGGKRHGGLWEFPGGKVREGEDVDAALRRELLEELALEVVSVGRVVFTRRDPGSPYVIEFVEAEVTGEPRSLEHQALAWCSAVELQALPLAPADRAFAEWRSGEPGHGSQV